MIIHKRNFYFWLLIGIIISAGLGPLLRFGDLTLARLLSFLMILLGLPYILRVRSLSGWISPVFGLLYGLCLLAGTEHLIASDIFGFSLYFGYGLVAMVISQISFTSEQIRQLSYTLVIVGILAALSVIYEFITGFSWHTSDEVLVMLGDVRPRGLHGDPNAVSDFILVAAFSSFYLYLDSMRSKRILIFFICVLFVCVWGLYVTASRGAVISLFFASLPFFIYKKMTFSLKILLVLLFSLLIAEYQFFLRGREFSLYADAASTARAGAWRSSWETFLQSPFIGDIGYYQDHYLSYYNSPHNNFFLVLAFGGLISIIPYIYIHWLVVKNYLRNNYILIMPTCIFLAFFGGGLTHATINNIVFWCIIGVCFNRYLS